MKRILYFALAVAGAAAMVCSCGNKSKKAESEAADAAAKEARLAEVVAQKIDSLPAEPVFDIITNMGIIKVKLDEGTPKHRENFARLAFSGYYDGILFHRVINGFMIQGGDPEGTGMGGPGYGIKGEFAQNGVQNDLKHTAGVLSMARSMMPDSAGSQFFIMHKDAPHLDGAYAAFGKIIEGQDVVNAIAEVATDYSDRPLEDQVMETVVVETFGEEYPEPETV